MAKSLHVKTGDRVKVIAGKDRGAVGEVIKVFPESQRVVVQGVNLVKRHLRDRVDPGSGQQTKGGVVSQEAAIHVSNVQLVVRDASGAEVPTRVGWERKDVTKTRTDGSEYPGSRGVRIARKTGKEI